MKKRFAFFSLLFCLPLVVGISAYAAPNDNNDKEVGQPCTGVDLDKRGGIKGHYIRGKDNTKSCAVTECKDGLYKVYHATKINQSNGYCKPMPKDPCPEGQTRIRDEKSIYSRCIPDPNAKAAKPDTDTGTESTDPVVAEQDNGEVTTTEVTPVEDTGVEVAPVNNDSNKEPDAAQTGNEDNKPGDKNESTPSKADGEGNGTQTDDKGNDTKTGDASASQSDDAEQNKNPAAEELQRQHIADLQKNYDDIKANEQSTANKLIGAVGVGATGIGGMMAMSALAEQRADADAERDMKAYLETMRCDYGRGMNIKGGDTGIELPGGNDLAMLHMEYALLADSVKTAKAGLGLPPGIESEITLDKAETGLYDNGAIGKTGGAYTSIARALQDPEGVDAIAWEQLKNDTKKKLKTGAIVAGVGAAGSLVANVIANAKAPKESSAELNRRYADAIAVFKDTQKKVDALPTVSKCSDFKLTGTYPNCDCGANAVFGNDGCIHCTGGRVNKNNECTCPSDKPQINQTTGECSAPTQTCPLTGVVTNPGSADCTCGDHTKKNGDACKCDSMAGYVQEDNTCVSKREEKMEQMAEEIIDKDTEMAKLRIEADTAFKHNKSTLERGEMEKILNEFGAALEEALTDTANAATIESKNYCLRVTGHADRTGWNKLPQSQWKAENMRLSIERAQTIANAITGKHQNLAENVKIEGKGQEKCLEGEYPKDDPRCRRVDVRLTAGKCSD